jgi:hydrogenase 3 maturation protease
MHLKELILILRKYDPARIVFVGLGNRLRGDDYAGIYTLKQLKKTRYFNKAVFIDAGTTPENYICPILINNPEAVVFLDAADWGGNPGEIKLISPEEVTGLGFSTHSYSVRMIEELLQMHGKTNCYYIGIQKDSTAYTGSLSQAVVNGIRNLISTP